jgi:2-amino-4-hydroxy-6-hydroxymethyldihydropteridine diphosphokinase
MPQKKSERTSRPVTAYIGVGSNILPEKNIVEALRLLSERTSVRNTSTFYRTAPLERRDQPEYRNGVWQIATLYSPEILKYKILREIENILKRKRGEDKYASRTIDLDLLLYEDKTFRQKGLMIPDPDIYQRPFIAAGIFELDPGLCLPDSNTGIKYVLARMNREALRPDRRLTNRLRKEMSGLNTAAGNQSDLWRLEYETLRGINLSYSDREPAPVSVFLSLIAAKKIRPPQSVLDIGCGKGRIGLHLALAGFHVTGLDSVPTAVMEFRRMARSKGLERNVEALVGDMHERWRMPDHAFDCAFAITVIDNLITVRSRRHFIKELLRVLSEDGLFVLECYDAHDEYYGKILGSSGGESGIVTDPNNKMCFKIYSESELQALFGPYFRILHREDASWLSVKYNRRYRRRSTIRVFQKRAGCSEL